MVINGRGVRYILREIVEYEASFPFVVPMPR
jgi:hypothetical protein